ncbi:MAG TPA: hypothetical protein VLL54_04100 [Pyrinomonadaceae bacterium]|nr:hypothetical protein [Pyrinomonadaceae bacterium]
MKKTSKAAILGFALVMICAGFSASQAQTPYPSLRFEREAGKDGTLYQLRPVVEEIHKRIGGEDKPFKILTAVARPANGRVVLLLVNAQQHFQFDDDTNVTITADSRVIKDITYTVSASGNEKSEIKLEVANALISLADFRSIATADSVVVKFGKVTYQLDKENREALRFLLNEIDKDNK